jgi:hypothetical protein
MKESTGADLERWYRSLALSCPRCFVTVILVRPHLGVPFLPMPAADLDDLIFGFRCNYQQRHYRNGVHQFLIICFLDGIHLQLVSSVQECCETSASIAASQNAASCLAGVAMLAFSAAKPQMPIKNTRASQTVLTMTLLLQTKNPVSLACHFPRLQPPGARSDSNRSSI